MNNGNIHFSNLAKDGLQLIEGGTRYTLGIWRKWQQQA